MLHKKQKEYKDGAEVRIITRAQFISRTRAGESVQLHGETGTISVSRVGTDKYTADGESYSLQGLLTKFGKYHAEFGEAVFFAA